MSAMTTQSLDAARRKFIEAGGNTTQSFGFGRIPGQVFALLYLSAKPLCLDDIARELGVSKASVSTTVRQLEQWAAVRRVWVKGDRKDYYEAETDFGTMLRHGLLMTFRKKLETAGAQIGHVEDSLKRAMETVDDAQRQELEVVANRLQRARDFHDRISGMLTNPVIDQLL
jgi:DNA-binding transcriptional regulator GbsR (MarR family)